MASPIAILALKALDGLNARATATAENIANGNTPNYRPLRVTFENALKQAALDGNDAVASVQPKVERALANTPDGELRIDLETATAAGTALRYSALVEVLDRETQMQSLAITGNT